VWIAAPCSSGKRAEEQLPASGVLLRIGSEPNTDTLEDVVELDSARYVIASAQLDSSAAYVLACGDVRSGARQTIVEAVRERAAAAGRACELLLR